MLITLLVMVLVLCAAGLSLAIPLRLSMRNNGKNSLPKEWAFEDLPMTSVVIPCKGDDGTLLKNLSLVVAQEHPRVEFILSAATAEDPACAVFQELKRRFPQVRIKPVVAGVSPVCSQTCNNQVAGIASADPASEILVIVDSDGQCDRRFIAKLVAPLADPSVGATTGFRWYQPDWRRFPEILRSAWNAGGYAFLVSPVTRYLFGGAMAFRRKQYEELGIGQLWSRALDDDMTLTMRLKSNGWRLHFVHDCIVVSRARDTLLSAFRWTNRQTQITRFYNAPFFLVAAIFHTVGNLLGWGLLLAGAAGLFLGASWQSTAALTAGVLWLLHLWVFALLLCNPLRNLLEPHGIALGMHKWILVTVAPLASILQGLNCIYSVCTRRVTWAGITYQIDHPERIRVV